MAFDHYGFAGHPVVRTPHIDALAAQSIRYPQAYTSSTCRPNEATLLTGLPEHLHGVTTVFQPVSPDVETFLDRLANVGYSSYQAGSFQDGSPVRRGFTDFYPFNGYVGNTTIGKGADLQPIKDFMATSSPWFLWYAPPIPHAPHDAPLEYVEMYEGLGLSPAVVQYYAMISWLDDAVAEIMAEVDDDTIVIFLSDNGYLQSDEPGSAPNSKFTSYEYGTRTQLLIRYPGAESVERMELRIAEDVPATILEIAGAYHDDLPGKSLLESYPDAEAYGSRSIQGEEPNILIERWIRSGDWKLVDSVEGEDRMHNLQTDPLETQNEFNNAAYSQILLQLQAGLEAWWAL
jgi:arylsulfatase A-like enzyme